MDTFSMERISLVTTLACNLNCKLCSIDAPYRRQEKILLSKNKSEWSKNILQLLTT